MYDSDKTMFRQREFLRLATSIPIHLMCLPKDGRVPNAEWVVGQITEIGGGGARVEVDADVHVDDSLAIRFVIPDTENHLKIYARAVHTTPIDGGTSVNTKFVGLSEDERGAILRYAFREQIRRAKDPVSGSHQSPQGVGDDG